MLGSGTVRYVGPMKNEGKKVWLGVELDRPRATTLLYKAKARERGEPLPADAVKPAQELTRGAAFYRSLEEKGFPAGGEFVAAIEEARQLNATVLLGDRDINVTLQRLKERHRKAPDLILRQRDSKAPAAHPCTLRRIAPSGALPPLRRGPHDLAEIEDYVYMT